MPDYKNGNIYTIRCRDDPALIYVGSTTQQLSQRFTNHIKKFDNPNKHDYTMKIYQCMRNKSIEFFTYNCTKILLVITENNLIEEKDK